MSDQKSQDKNQEDDEDMMDLGSIQEELDALNWDNHEE